jgi:hypothetical protein
MSEKDSVAMARILRVAMNSGVDYNDSEVINSVSNIAYGVAAYCAENVENFDKELFLLSCGM